MSGIKVITEPRIYLVGRQVIDDGEIVRFLADEGVENWTTDTEVAAQMLVEVAGRLCYRSYANPRPGGNAAYIAHILEVGHGSVLEHAVYSVVITGVSRSLTHELVRHRVGLSFSQLSQRFVDEADCAFVAPPLILGSGPSACAAFAAWDEHCQYSAVVYGELVQRLMHELADVSDKTLRRKQAREAARSVLPNCVETQIFVTGNARAWRHMLELRGSIHADAEFRRLALALLGVLKTEAPNIFGDIGVMTDDAGGEYLSVTHHKV